MRIGLIVNPGSGGGTDPAAVADALRAAGAQVVRVETAGVEPAQIASSQRGSFERLAVASGDGQVATAAALAARLGVPLAVLPAGTANDFAREHGLPDDLAAAAELAVLGTSLRQLELAFIEDRPFVNVASCGLAPVAAERAAGLKRVLGALAYPIGALVAALRASPLPVAAAVDGELLFDGRAWQVTVASSGAFGGGASLDVASASDGLLNAVCVPAGARAGLVRRGWAMRRGHLASQADVPHAAGRTVELSVPAGTPFNVDGELEAYGPGVSFTVRPRAYALVIG